jgi:hypothetical protein
MHEFIKRGLIVAVLAVSALFAPCLPKAADFPDQTSELVRRTAGPMFWQFWDGMPRSRTMDTDRLRRWRAVGIARRIP